MSNQCLRDAFEAHENRYAAQVMIETWGHLAPPKNTIFRGWIIWALGCHGSDRLNPTVLECELKDRKGNELDSSPWFFDAMIDMLQSFEVDEGGVYQWDGFFRNYEFVGTITRMQLQKS